MGRRRKKLQFMLLFVLRLFHLFLARFKLNRSSLKHAAFSLLLPIQKRYQTQRIVKQSGKKKFIRLYLGIKKHAKLRKRAPYESKTL